MKFTLKQMS